MLLGMTPTHFPETMNVLWKQMDDIWYHCGDKSLDFNYYTKRAILLKVFVSTGNISILNFIYLYVNPIYQFFKSKLIYRIIYVNR